MEASQGTGPVLWIPAAPLAKSLANGEMVIGGMATLDDTVDLDQQLLQHTGVIDSLSYLERYGKVNWNHSPKASDLLGDIRKACIKHHKGKQGLYIEAVLNPEVPEACAAYRFMKGGGRLGFSVQGVTLKLKPVLHKGRVPAEDIETSFISQVALTPEPKNHETFAAILKSVAAGAMSKSLTAGSGTDHAHFTGGRSLTAESFASPPVEQLAQLARHFHSMHGDLPRPSRRFEKALIAFAKSWGLAPDATMALAKHMGGVP